MRTFRRQWLTVIAIAAVMAAACGDDQSASPEQAAAEGSEEPGREVDLVGDVALDPAAGPAGTDVAVQGSGLPANTTLDLLWVGAECHWIIEGDANEEYKGRDCPTNESEIASVETDADGNLEASFAVPDGYGFAHDVLIVDDKGVVRNRALFSVEMSVSVTPTSGPVGTPITIEVRGMGYQSLEDTRTILYDNRYTGFMSAVTTSGTARAVIPAVGAPGPHKIEINRGAYTFPYLNPHQSPRPDIPSFDATFTVTEGDAVLPAPIDDQNPRAEARSEALPDTGPAITTDVASGPVGDPLTVTGAGFAADQEMELRWFRIVGNRVAGQGWEERAITIGTVTTDADGAFEFATEIPGDVGGPHRLSVFSGDEALAETSVSVVPHADALAAETFTFGEDLGIHVTGVGWTETANIYTIIYDNAYVGYACGFNTQGDIDVQLTATGEPGWHYVELYPAIYKGDEKPGRNNFRIPQLTAADDHPGEDLPIFRFAFEIEE